MKDCRISFYMDENGHAKTELRGSSLQIMFCLVGLIKNACDGLHLPLSVFAGILPAMAEIVKADSGQSTLINLDALQKQMGAEPRDGDLGENMQNGREA